MRLRATAVTAEPTGLRQSADDDLASQAHVVASRVELVPREAECPAVHALLPVANPASEAQPRTPRNSAHGSKPGHVSALAIGVSVRYEFDPDPTVRAMYDGQTVQLPGCLQRGP